MRCFFIASLVACGSTQTPEPAEPAWATEWVAEAERGCACETPACLHEAKAALDVSLEEQGGFEMAPPSVHAAYRDFDQCFNEGTPDLLRDLAAAREVVCGCSDQACVRDFRRLALRIHDDYQIDVLGDAPALEGDERLAFDETARCWQALSVSVEELTQMFEISAVGLCGCETSDCYERVMADHRVRMQGRLVVRDLDDEGQLEGAKAEFCRCQAQAAASGVVEQIARLFGRANVSVDLNIDISCN